MGLLLVLIVVVVVVALLAGLGCWVCDLVAYARTGRNA